MADDSKTNWYPPPGHPQDEVNRIAFDNLYQLRDQQTAGRAGTTPPQGGMSGTAVLATPFTIGGKSFTKLIFSEGRIVGVATGSNTGGTPINNSGGSGGGTPVGVGGLPGGGTPVPPGTPVVSAIPSTGDPLSVIGQAIIVNGIPFTFTVDPSGGPTGFWKQQTSSVINITGTHAARSGFNAASYPVGTTYYETDTAVLYMVQNPAGTNRWMYYNGVYSANLANLPTLGVFDVNYTFQALDYLQIWVWSGSAYNFAAGSGSGYFVFVQAPAYLPYGVWGQTDGVTAYLVSQNNATTVSETPTNVSGRYIRR